jgi:hypothetical protein
MHTNKPNDSKVRKTMPETWEKDLACAIGCARCGETLSADQDRILSIFDHEPICMSCKKKEEQRPDYPEKAKQMIGDLMAETEIMYGDPGGFAYFHFYPFKC